MRDLRELIEDWRANGQLKIVEGADADLDIGALAEVSGSGTEPPALLFDRIKGYPQGYRVLINMFQTQRRTAEALGVADSLRGPALVDAIRKRMADHKPVPPKLVASGPITEHVEKVKDIDIFRFPAPKLHKDDGGKYIGTQDAVITKDPVGGWVNLGTARVQVQEPSVVSIYISPGKQTRLIAEQY